MKAFVFAALVACAYAQPGGVTETNADLTTEENATTDVTVTETQEVQTETTTSTETINLDDYQITEATDYYNNAETKGAYEEFDWDAYNMSNFTFADLMDLLNSDATSAALAERVKGSFKSYYETQVANLPKVCEGGILCR